MLSVNYPSNIKCMTCPIVVNKSQPIEIKNNKNNNLDLASSAKSYYIDTHYCGQCGSASPTIVEPFLESTTKKSRSVDDAGNMQQNTFQQEKSPIKTAESPLKKGLTMHVVTSSNETLTSIAARYDCTPSELIKLNKLNTTRLVFPGQKIKVPQTNSTSCDEVFENEKQVPTPQQKKFCKTHVRHITDGNGVVGGTLLVTPNAVMFDPNVSDPLVIEQGAETYGVILPLELIVHCAIYSDIAGMKVRGKTYYRDLIHDLPLLYPNTIQIDKSEDNKKEKVLKRLSFPLAFIESLTASTNEEEACKSAPPISNYNANSFDEQRLQERETKEEEITWYLCLSTGRPKHWTSHTKTGLIVSYGQKNHVRPEYWFHIVEKRQVQELYNFWMVWWPHLYSEKVDKELISARGYDVIDWDSMDLFSSLVEKEQEEEERLQAKLDHDKDFTKESWEMLKSPYTKLSSLLNRSQTLLTSTSSSATNFGQGILDSISDFASLDLNEEVVSMSDELRQALYGNYNTDEYGLPELIGNSEILQEDDLHNLSRHLTARAEGYPWTLTFSSSIDGFSLSTLYRKMPYCEETPLLLLIEDTCSNVFGALISTGLRPSEGFYGTGQSFLFNLRPQFRTWKWTGENMYFIKCSNTDGVVIGAGDGKFGLWLDGDLNCGRTESCSTYGNPPLVDSSDFVIKTLEVWAFYSSSSSSSTNQPQQPQELLDEVEHEKLLPQLQLSAEENVGEKE